MEERMGLMTVTNRDVRAVRAPLVIGVTGHRDLLAEDLEPLENKVRESLRSLQTQYPSTPIILLSPLAEGADRLAARVALEIGARLIVPLPMARSEYEQDFKSGESLEEFHRLLEQAEHRFEVPLPARPREGARAGTARDRQYEEVGKYIARESQILLALWNGIPSGKVGGTTEIVGFKLRVAPDRPDCDLQPLELFPVYRIVTRRRSSPALQGPLFELVKEYPDGFGSVQEAEGYYDKIFRNLDDFNIAILTSSYRQPSGNC